MELVFECPCCGSEIEADAELGGGMAQCPGCKETILVPAAGIGEGTELAGYRVIRQLGIGGMGEVFLAKQVAMDREVALKVLPPAMTKSEDSVARFLHETRVAAKLAHPNIVTAFDAGEADGYFYLAMSFVDGEDLDDRLHREGRLPERDALIICLEVAEALDYAWCEHRILHRDVKPANLMIDRSGDVKLMDMGIAKSLADDSHLTMAGMYVGTPFYMSPEQCRAESDLDCRSDIYALGATLYHLVTGEKPFVAANSVAVLTAHLTQALSSPRLLAPELSIALDHLLSRMMAKDRDKRYCDWQELIVDLRAMLEAEDTRALGLPPLPDPLPVGGLNADNNPPATLVTQLAGLRSAVASTAEELPGLKPIEADDEEPVTRPAVTGTAVDASLKEREQELTPAAPLTSSRTRSRAFVAVCSVVALLALCFGGLHLWQAAQRSGSERVAKQRNEQADRELEAVVAVEGAIAYQQTRAEIAATAETRDQQLSEMIVKAREFEGANPADVAGALGRYEAIAEHSGGTQHELVVTEQIARLSKRLANAPDEVLRELQRESQILAASWRFDEAGRLLSRYEGPMAERTLAARQQLAGSYLATGKFVDQLLIAVRPGLEGLATLRLEPLRDLVLALESEPQWRDDPMAARVAADFRGVLTVGAGFFDSFAGDVGQDVRLVVDGREGRWRIRGIGDMAVRAELDGRSRMLPMAAFSAREILNRLSDAEPKGHALVKAVLASRAGRDDVVEATISALPDGLVPRALQGELMHRRLAGAWQAANGDSLRLRDASMSLTLSGRRIVGPCAVFAGKLLLISENAEVSQRFRLNLDHESGNLQLSLAKDEVRIFVREK